MSIQLICRGIKDIATDPPLAARVPGADAVDDPVDQLIGDGAPL
jgi:hypothetical protein